MRIVIKIGGSILFKDGRIKTSIVKDWIEKIQKLLDSKIQVGLVIGGGIAARDYIFASKELGATADYQDFLGIESARQNARLFISGFRDAYPTPPENYEELIHAVSTHQLVITGGFQPGQSTNAVAAIFAEHMRADYLFNMSNVDKVFDKDPSKHDDAIPYDTISYDKLSDIITLNEQTPGKYALFDYLGNEIIKRSSIKLVFLNGNHPEYIEEVINGKSRGTIVQ